MEESKIFQYFEGKTIFITGATGFLAKIFLEKMLRVQPNIKKLYLLIRENTKRSIERRLQEEVFDTALFRVLREEYGEDLNSVLSSKVVPIAGDVSYDNLGITDSELREEMLQEIDIIVNSAATTKFDERYDIAMGINAFGAMNVRNFAKNCSKLDRLLHVSTAFVHGSMVGLIPEKSYHMGEILAGSKIPHLDINTEGHVIEETLKQLKIEKATEKKTTQTMKDLGINRAKLHGWPNTYVFTKAIGEMMFENFKDKAKVIIIRPTIITSTYREPFPGWIEGVRTLDSIFVAYGKGKLKFFVGDPESKLDMIPGDMVVNCMIAAIGSHSNDKHDLSVYQIGSSRRNPIKYDEIKWLMHRYLTKNPLLDSRGKPIQVGHPTTLNTMASFHNYIAIHYLPFLQVLNLINIICCNRFESIYTNARRRIHHAKRLAELYKPYLFFQGIFDDVNTENLQMSIRGSNMNMGALNFDPKCIHWDEYFMNNHFTGIAKYALK